MTDRHKKTEQLYFFMMPAETSLFLEHVLEVGVLLLGPRSERQSPTTLETLTEVGQSFLCPEEELCSVRMNKATDGVFFLDPSVSPVVEFQNCVLRKSGLARGRLYYRSGYDGRDGWVNFPDSVAAIYEKASFYLRGQLLTRYRECDAWLSKGARQFVELGGELVQV